MTASILTAIQKADTLQIPQWQPALEIPEYWVIDVLGRRAIAFRLQPDGKYQQCVYSVALKGLPIPLLDQTLERLGEGTNISAASWFAQQIAGLNVE